MTGRLRAEGLVVRYGRAVALDGVDLSDDPGRVVGLVGANGAGKTTLLDCLSGQRRPSAGRIRLDGEDVTRRGPAARARRGMVRTFQDARLFPTMAVRDVLRLAVAGTRPGQARTATEADLVERLALQPLLDHRVGELSTGEGKRLDLACAIGLRPRVLLLDEPSAGLAAAEVPGMAAVLAQVAEATGASVVMVEHDLPLVWRLADRVVVLDRGKVVAEGPPAAVAGHPALAFGRKG